MNQYFHYEVQNPREPKTCPYKNVYMNVHCSNIHDSQKVDTIHIPITCKWVNNVWYIHSMEYYSARKKEQTIDTEQCE